MSIALTNKIMQSTVPFVAQDQAGAVAQDRMSLSYDVDGTVADKTVFYYGDFVALAPQKGAGKVAATTPASGLLGIVKYQNSGVIDYAGYQVTTGLYTNLPVLKQGVVVVNSTGTVDLDSVVYLYVDPSDTTNYGKIKNGSGSGAIDISSIAKVVKKSNSSNLTEIDINII